MIHVIPITKPRIDSKKHYFPDNHFTHKLTNRSAQFHSSTELRMGFLVSKLAIYEKETNITHNHLLSNYKFYSIPKCYDPWSYDGDIICVTTVNTETLGSDIRFYSLSKKKFIFSRAGNSVALLCSPSVPYVLMTEYDQRSHTSHPYIVNFKGKRICDIPLQSVPINLFISWLKTEMQFIAITKDPMKPNNNWLYHGDAKTGEILGKIPFNCQKLIPHEKEENQIIPKEKNPVNSETSYAYGEMLNEWTNIRFDAKNNILTSSYLRPIGKIFKNDLLEPATRIINYEVKYKIVIED